MAKTLGQLSSQQLRRALAIREKIEALEAELNRILSEKDSSAAADTKAGGPARGAKPKRRMSPEAKAKIAAAARARWARVRAEEKKAGGKGSAGAA